MKKTLWTLAIVLLSFTMTQAQNVSYALIDMQYIANTLPQYKQATETLKNISEQYEKEIKGYRDQAKKLYIQYKKDVSALSAEEKVKRENQIVATEDKAQELQEKYFGPKGLMAQRQEQLIKPLQDKIYEAVKYISQRRGYLLVVDRASTAGVIFADPQIDISNDVLSVLGYSK